MSSIVPDGIVCYFPSFKYMQFVIIKWNESGILQRILDTKLIFIEQTDQLSTLVQLNKYRQACDTGRGAVLFACARSSTLDNIPLSNHYSRCVIVFGVPFQNTLCRTTKVHF